MRLSFVIPVRNDAKRLQRCLASIARAAGDSGGVEVVVVDNGSTDDSRAAAERMGARVVPAPGMRVSELRNRGVGASSGEVLAFVDADHEIAPEWVVAAIDAFKDPSVGGVGALCSPPPDGNWVQRMYGALRGATRGKGDVEWLGSGNLAVRRAVFDSLGGFDSALDACEDVDLCQRLRAAGYRLVGDERLGNVHFGDPASLAALFRGELWRGRDNLRVSLRGALSPRSLPSIVIPNVELVLLVAMLLLPLVLGRDGLLISALCGGVILGLAALRAARMIARLDARSLVTLGEAFVVALVYDLARAVALAWRAAHHRR